MGCLTCACCGPATSDGPLRVRRKAGSSVVRARGVRGAGARGSPGRRQRRDVGVGLDRLFQVLDRDRERRASPARIRGSHRLHGRLVRLDSPRRVARSRAGRARGRTGRRSAPARRPSRHGTSGSLRPGDRVDRGSTHGTRGIEGGRRASPRVPRPRRDTGARPHLCSRFGGADPRARFGATVRSRRARSPSRRWNGLLRRVPAQVLERPRSDRVRERVVRLELDGARRRLGSLRVFREVVQLRCPSDQVGRATLVGLRHHALAFGSPLGSVPAIGVGIVLARSRGTSSGRLSARDNGSTRSGTRPSSRERAVRSVRDPRRTRRRPMRTAGTPGTKRRRPRAPRPTPDHRAARRSG